MDLKRFDTRIKPVKKAESKMEEETEADADTEEGIDRKDETEEAEEIEETKPFNSQSNVEKKILCTETAAKLNSKLEMPSRDRRGHFSYVI